MNNVRQFRSTATQYHILGLNYDKVKYVFWKKIVVSVNKFVLARRFYRIFADFLFFSELRDRYGKYFYHIIGLAINTESVMNGRLPTAGRQRAVLRTENRNRCCIGHSRSGCAGRSRPAVGGLPSKFDRQTNITETIS